ncbi:alpha-L-fucosidase [Vibrio penaeicida]|uniref:alpha-L-fucosidase n=1 Tax=Vibrio penaeicida TaxID=104609 RepID=UPI002733E459|nr:alpha-L-fucosidase [Vibrio penaeicida]MDP2575881.1 alpha-L-fucosidase [Vibrio penaeicida]
MQNNLPTQRQLEFQSWEMGIFVHFGIRTFNEGVADFSQDIMSPSSFNPTQLDCNQWAKVASDSGANYMVFVAKHHDGFANWPSQYTDYSVASSSWQSGKGDVVQQYVDACRAYDLRVGLYYSPADINCPIYEDEKAYDDYFIDQVTELLDGRYGDIDMLWFDGCGSENHTYDWTRIVKAIREMQPNILLFNMGDPDYRWVGNESGIAPSPCFNTISELDFSIKTQKRIKVSEDGVWLPAECDFMMRDNTWFYSENTSQTVKQPDELVGIYHYSVGRGTNMLLNIGPDRKGLFPNEEVDSLNIFAQKIQRKFSNPIASIINFSQANDVWESRLPESQLIDCLVLQEETELGEAVESFRILITPYTGGNAIVVYQGTSIGHKAIARFPTVRTAEIRVEITSARQNVQLKTINVFK